MSDLPSAAAELTEVAASSEPLPDRAQAMLHVLRRHVPFDSAWFAQAGARPRDYRTVASADLDGGTLDYLAGPRMARDIEITGTDRDAPPLSPSDLPYPAEDLPTWAECLIPGGYHEALAVALFLPGNRHVGFLALLSADERPPPPRRRRLLGRLTPLLAHGIDPLRSLLSAARLVQGATAGIVLCADGGTRSLPGLAEHALLGPRSAAIDAVAAALAEGRIWSTFLWPVGGRHAPDGHIRITVLGTPADAPPDVAGMALVSPPGDLRGLTPRELEVLGLMIEGGSNAEIARALVVSPRTVAAHVEHILAKLDAPSRALAAVRAARDGLYVPPTDRRD